MADVSYPHISSSLSLSSVIFSPENHINSSLLSPLSLSECGLCCPDSEPGTCCCDLEMEPKVDPLDCDYHDNQVRFVSNLFDRSSVENPTFGSPLRLSLGGGSSEVDLELGLGLYREGSVDPSPPSTGGLELFREGSVAPLPRTPGETRRFEGLRVVSFDSDSDSDDGFLRASDEIDGGFGGVSDFDRPPFCWDYLGFNDRRNNSSNDEQNGVDGNCQIHEREIELPATDNGDDGGDFFGQCHDRYDDDADDGESPISLDMDEAEREVREVSLLFDTYQERAEQEIMIPSDTDEGGEFDVEEAIRDLEWEILLAVNNFNREVYDMDINVNMYDAILSEVEERMNSWRGSPPAANSVIENLPIVCLSAESLKENHVACAICKDDISGEEEVRQLPCSHYYHGDCIFPWLKIHNTCPVCRYELPTDDPNYEYMKREREGPSTEGDVPLNSQVEYDFHVFL